MVLFVTILWGILFLLFSCLAVRLKRFIVSTINVRKLPGPPTQSILFGNMLNFLTTPDKLFQIQRDLSRQYYPIFQTWLAHFSAAAILSPEDFEIVLTAQVHSQKSFIYNVLKGWLQTGLLTSKGEKWHTRRKMLTPAFHFNILRQFVPIFNEHASSLVESLKRECHQPYITVNNHVKQFTLKSIAETAMGSRLEFKTKTESDYQKAIVTIVEGYLFRNFRPWLLIDFIYFLTPYGKKETKLTKTLHQFTENVIRERQENFQLPSSTSTSEEQDTGIYHKKRMAMMDLMLTEQMSGHIDNEGIREEVDTFMFEGHDTTAMAITFGLMELAGHKDIQEKIVQEMLEVLGDIEKEPTPNDLQALNYLERCIKEILRIYPSVPFISRRLGEDIITTSGYTLSKGLMTNLHIYDLHHNPRIYPDPEKFDPDRFLPENCQNRHPFAYLPFSAGPRNCIGQKFAMLELKAVFCAILSNFVLEPVDTPSTIVFIADLVLRTKDDIKVKFIPRS